MQRNEGISIYAERQGIINAKLGRNTAIPVSQLQGSQSLKILKKQQQQQKNKQTKKGRLHMVTKNNNEDGQTH